MDYLTTAAARETPEFPRRASESTLMEYHKKQTRRGTGLRSQERHLQNKYKVVIYIILQSSIKWNISYDKQHKVCFWMRDCPV